MKTNFIFPEIFPGQAAKYSFKGTPGIIYYVLVESVSVFADDHNPVIEITTTRFPGCVLFNLCLHTGKVLSRGGAELEYLMTLDKDQVWAKIDPIHNK